MTSNELFQSRIEMQTPPSAPFVELWEPELEIIKYEGYERPAWVYVNPNGMISLVKFLTKDFRHPEFKEFMYCEKTRPKNVWVGLIRDSVFYNPLLVTTKDGFDATFDYWLKIKQQRWEFEYPGYYQQDFL